MKLYTVKRTIKHYQTASFPANNKQEAVDMALGFHDGTDESSLPWKDAGLGEDFEVTSIVDTNAREFDVDENGNVDE